MVEKSNPEHENELIPLAESPGTLEDSDNLDAVTEPYPDAAAADPGDLPGEGRSDEEEVAA